MFERSLTPNITVTIGHHTRIYFAFVTTAPTRARLAGDGHAARGDVRGRRQLRGRTDHASIALAAGHPPGSSSSTRWSSPGNERSIAAISICCCRRIPDSSDSTRSQHWLWQRLQAPAGSQVAA